MTSTPFPPTLTCLHPPGKPIAAMMQAIANDETASYVAIDCMRSIAWELYEAWACSLGEVDPRVSVAFLPSPDIAHASPYPPGEYTDEILREAASIVHHMALLRINDFVNGMPMLPGPLQHPPAVVNLHHATIAVSSIPRALANPGPNFPVINALHGGVYICTVTHEFGSGLLSSTCMSFA
ncbi:hypothetical protein AaE_004980 [Aphanomyces astaci]|uniref:Uncharacterized protein n=1 Tax=Aphanomyces astaci TaxID=112090 RepID=A0A6A5ALP7_APHAT|nr:hypothetical protein AaE_004980 [Aphanomyces astaci]